MLFVSFNMWTTHPSASSFLTSATPESIRPDATRSWAVEVHWSRPQVCVLLPNCMNWIFWVQKTELYEETKMERATLLASGWWFLLKSTMNHTSWSRILWSLIKVNQGLCCSHRPTRQSERLECWNGSNRKCDGCLKSTQSTACSSANRIVWCTNNGFQRQITLEAVAG